MKIAKGLQENGIFIGNTYDKYNSKNFIARYLLKGYDTAFNELISKINPISIHEVGCGEGYWTLKLAKEFKNIRGTDFSTEAIRIAKENAQSQNVDSNIFSINSIYDISEEDSANLVICCEVLEHLEYPEKALKSLLAISNPYLLISVPREPLWSVLNVCRGKYLAQFGNTPGHIQKWSYDSFKKLVSKYYDILEVRLPIPWIFLLCKVK